MSIKSKKYQPSQDLKKYVDAFWFFENHTGKTVFFPVVPDGCSDIIFYLNDSAKLNNANDTFISGVMEYAQVTPIPNKTKLFGIRFKPGMLALLLNTDMSKLSDKNSELAKINNKIFQNLKINGKVSYSDIVSKIEPKLKTLFKEDNFQHNCFQVIENIKNNPQITISELSKKYGFSIKNLERYFCKIIGLTPKKFARIMRFQKAHKQISKAGLNNLITIALSAGYFDQAHFNREYKKLTGNNPSSETMSILYNK